MVVPDANPKAGLKPVAGAKAINKICSGTLNMKPRDPIEGIHLRQPTTW
jgi:hypothetical protein